MWNWMEEMATHSSVLAWRISGTGESGGLLSMGSHRVGHDWSDLAAAAAVSNVEKAMVPHSSFLAWKIPWTGEPGGLQSMRSWRVRHDWATSFHLSLSCIGEGNGNPLQCSCLENPRNGRAWWAAIYGVAQSRTRLKRFSSSSRELPHVHRFLNLELLCKEILFCLSYFCFRLCCFISLGCNFVSFKLVWLVLAKKTVSKDELLLGRLL